MVPRGMNICRWFARATRCWCSAHLLQRESVAGEIEPSPLLCPQRASPEVAFQPNGVRRTRNPVVASFKKAPGVSTRSWRSLFPRGGLPPRWSHCKCILTQCLSVLPGPIPWPKLEPSPWPVSSGLSLLACVPSHAPSPSVGHTPVSPSLGPTPSTGVCLLCGALQTEEREILEQAYRKGIITRPDSHPPRWLLGSNLPAREGHLQDPQSGDRAS